MSNAKRTTKRYNETGQEGSIEVSDVKRLGCIPSGLLSSTVSSDDQTRWGDGSSASVELTSSTTNGHPEPPEKKASTARSIPEREALWRKESETTGLEDLTGLSYRYHELIRGSYSTKALIGRFDKLERNPHYEPLWRSYFSFDNHVRAYLRTHDRILKSYPFPVGISEIILDLDTKDGISPDEVLKEARTLIQYLVKYHDIELDYLRVFFSGSKGYHIHMPNLFGFKPSDNLPDIVKATLINEFGFCESLDTTMIRKNGLIRVPYSRHQETGLYKQPIAWKMFFNSTVEDIKASCRVPVFRKWNLPDEIETPLAQLRCAPKVEVRGFYKDNRDTTTRVTCMQKLYNRGAIDGRGHRDSLRLASWMRRDGMPKEAVLSVLEGWYNFVDTEDQVKVVNSIYDKQYTYSCQDEVMREFCDEKCMFFNRGWTDTAEESMINNSKTLLGNLQSYVRRIEASGTLNLKDVWPTMPCDYEVYPGETVIVTGDTGLGKSIAMQTLAIRQYPTSKMSVLYLNLEMNEAMATRRFLQVAHGYTKKEAMSAASRLDPEMLTRPWDHVQMISLAPQHNQVIEAVSKHKPGILIIDTTDAIEVPEAGNNDMHQLKVIVDMTRKLAQQFLTIVICIHHLSKKGATGSLLDLNALSGNRSVVTKADHVLAIIGNSKSQERKLISLKTRDTDNFELPLRFNAARMQMTDADTGAPLFEGETK